MNTQAERVLALLKARGVKDRAVVAVCPFYDVPSEYDLSSCLTPKRILTEAIDQ